MLQDAAAGAAARDVALLTSDADQERYDAENLVDETIVPAITD